MSVDTADRVLHCYFPMPLKVSARLYLVNKGVNSHEATLSVRYSPLAWDRDYGYFAAQYHHSEATILGVLHPVLLTSGRGRYVGVNFGFANSPYSQAVFMEGDGHFVVDSTPIALAGRSIEYSGTEDYCNSGWYFDSIIFARPFSGNSPGWQNMYRFHITDPYNYSRGLDVRWGHGFFDDYKETITTVAYYYEKHEPFYLSSDSVAQGSILTATGAGYRANEAVDIRLDGNIIASGRCDGAGKLSVHLPVSTSWSAGPHSFEINGVQSRVPLVVLQQPVVTFLQDSSGQTFSEEDSIRIRLYGFRPHQSLTLKAEASDSPLGAATFVLPGAATDSDGVFRVQTHLPKMLRGWHRLVAETGDGQRAVSDSQFYVTRVLNYEFEDLPTSGRIFNYAYLPVSIQWWSQSAIRFCYGEWKYGTAFSFDVDIPYADTFAVELYATTGNRYANYRMWIDGQDCGAHDWYLNVPWGQIARDSADLGAVYLTQGQHQIRFVNEGYHDSAVEYSLGVDNLHLTPLSEFSGTPRVPKPGSETSLVVYPNPVTNREVRLENLPIGTMWISLVDAASREVQRLIPGRPTDSVLTVPLPELPSGTYWLMVHTPYSNIARAFVVIR